jgi:hypothetical protein
MDNRLPIEIVEIEGRGCVLERCFSQLARDSGDAALTVDLRPGLGKQPQRILVVDFDSGIHEKPIPLLNDLLDKLLA